MAAEDDVADILHRFEYIHNRVTSLVCTPMAVLDGTTKISLDIYNQEVLSLVNSIPKADSLDEVTRFTIAGIMRAIAPHIAAIEAMTITFNDILEKTDIDWWIGGEDDVS